MDITSKPKSDAASSSESLRELVKSPEGGKSPDCEATVMMMLTVPSSDLYYTWRKAITTMQAYLHIHWSLLSSCCRVDDNTSTQ